MNGQIKEQKNQKIINTNEAYGLSILAQQAVLLALV